MVGILQTALVVVAVATWVTGQIKYQKLPRARYGHEWSLDKYNAAMGENDAQRQRTNLAAGAMCVVALWLFLL